ncbi:hypothetical protein ES703_104278 [subsurface metagenome]
MYDSDDPISKGQVGMSGATIDSVEDMEALFKDVPIDKVTVSLVTHYPSNTAILFPMYLVMAERRGLSWDKIGGSVQNDITLEEVVRSGAEYIPPGDCFRIQCDNIEFIRGSVPRFNFITYNGYNLALLASNLYFIILYQSLRTALILETSSKKSLAGDQKNVSLSAIQSTSCPLFSKSSRVRMALATATAISVTPEVPNSRRL